jgi:hypothetical protein
MVAPFPSSNKVDMYVKAGLATASFPATAVELNLQWGFKEMNTFLRTTFPQLFGYLSISCPGVLTVEADDDVPLGSIEWPYKLITCLRGKMSLVETIEHPTATDYYHKSATQPSRPWKEKTLHISV